MKLFFLKDCFPILKLQYILRTSPTFLFQNELVRFGETVTDGLQAILNMDLQDGTWTEVSLPLSTGGIGVSKSQDLSVPAFISSSHWTEMLVYAALHNTGIPPLGHFVADQFVTSLFRRLSTVRKIWCYLGDFLRHLRTSKLMSLGSINCCIRLNHRYF